MPLPKISTPSYDLVLPSTKKTIQYRPFLVREEKLLVLALESEDTKQISTAIKTVLRNCIETKGVKVETLPTFDIEYLFLNIRGKSVGEEVEVNIIAPDDGETEVMLSQSAGIIQVITLNNDKGKPIKKPKDDWGMSAEIEALAADLEYNSKGCGVRFKLHTKPGTYQDGEIVID